MNLAELNCPFLLLKNCYDEAVFTYKIDNIKQLDSFDEVESFYQKTDKDVLMLLPFSTIGEKYPDVELKHKNKIIISEILSQESRSLKVFDNFLNLDCLIKKSEFFKSDQEYQKSVSEVIENEINNGTGSNFTIVNKIFGSINDFNLEKAVGIFSRLCRDEFGYYQIFLLFTGKFFIVGASPECHLNVNNGRVRMQPISGTYCKNINLNVAQNKNELLNFLSNKKEVNELFMTVDEELKMMAKICSSGGMIIGPRLREMSKVIHTEYLLTGESSKDIFEIIKESVHAATVIGSPLKSGVIVSEKYNNLDREFHGGMLGILDRDGNFDSSILIRTAKIDNNGEFVAIAGASVVADSNPENECFEVKMKLSGLISSFGSANSGNNFKLMNYLQFDHDIAEKLYSRNQPLSNFWFFDKSRDLPKESKIKDIDVVIIENEDDFTNMLLHIIKKIDIKSVKIVNYNDFDLKNYNNLTLIIIGPGPGDPNDKNNHKMQKLTKLIGDLLKFNFKFCGVCLGHQVIANHLGFEVKKNNRSTQGEQKEIDLFGKSELVGFYNTFYAKYEKDRNDLQICYNQDDLNIHAIRGNCFFSTQFHPESILTQNGYNILHQELTRLYQ